MDIYILGRKDENSFLLYNNNELISQKELEGNVRLVIDKTSGKGFLHTGNTFIDFVKVSLLPNNQCYLTSRSNRLIYSVPPLGDSKEKVIIADRIKALGWETFDLIEIAKESDNFLDEITIIKDVYFNIDNNCDFFKNVIASNIQDKKSLLEKILELMTTCDLDLLSQHYLANMNELEILAGISNDIFFIESVNQITNKGVRKYFISNEMDFIADRKNLFSLSKNKWMHLNCYIRKQIKPKNKFCVVATAKNEGVYLLEWIAYYKHLGADAIFIYSNGNDDGSDKLLKALHNAEEIRYIENQVNAGCSAQNKAYTHALTINKEILDYEWSLFVDLDEYLIFNDSIFSSLHDFFDWHRKKDVHAIALNWIFSIPTNHGDWINTAITQRIKKFEKSTNGHIKSVIRPHFFSSSLPHHPITIDNFPFSYRTASGQPHLKSKKYDSLSISDNPSNTHAAILHFFNRTIPEFIWKYSRNRGDHPNVTDNSAFTESLLPFLKEFSTAIDSKNSIDSSSYFPKNIDINSLINKLLENEHICNAYLEVKNETKIRYDNIYSLFWEFLDEQKTNEKYKSDIEYFIDRFN